MKLIPAEIQFISQLTPNIKHFRVYPQTTPFHFKPGQWVDIYAPLQGKNISGYTIISANQQTGFFDLAIRESNFHPVTKWLHENVQNTASILISQALGKFTLKESSTSDQHVFFAGGIGITPLLSMIRSLEYKNCSLIYSAKNSTDFIFAKELQSCAQFFVTQELTPAQSTYHSSRVTKNIILERANLQAKHFYICGPLGFIQATQNNLLHLSVPESKIHFEKWW